MITRITMVGLALTTALSHHGNAIAKAPCKPKQTTTISLLDSFGLNGTAQDSVFEPSAAIWLDSDCRLITFSDKSSTLRFHMFQANSNGILDFRSEVYVSPDNVLRKMEAATQSISGDGFLVITSGSFSSAPFVPRSHEDQAFIIRRTAGGWTSTNFSANYRKFLTALRSNYNGWVKIEALGTVDGKYLAGIRQHGTRYDRFRYSVLVIEWDTTNPTMVNPVMNVPLNTEEEDGGYIRAYAVSGLDCRRVDKGADTKCLMLLSSEHGPTRNDISSRLYQFEISVIQANPPQTLADIGVRVACFPAKAEGVAYVSKKSAAIVFDSDLDRKGTGPDQYSLMVEQDFYSIVDLNKSEQGCN